MAHLRNAVAKNTYQQYAADLSKIAKLRKCLGKLHNSETRKIYCTTMNILTNIFFSKNCKFSVF